MRVRWRWKVDGEVGAEMELRLRLKGTEELASGKDLDLDLATGRTGCEVRRGGAESVWERICGGGGCGRDGRRESAKPT